jgi:Fe-S-cluster containining protein
MPKPASSSSPAQPPWYSGGLRFSCTQCGNCCSGPPGFVWFNDDEADAMAAFLKLSKLDFIRQYARKLYGKWSLKETRTPQGMDCVFLRRDPQGKALCSIYEVRPIQCQTWPFWPENLDSPQAWQDAASRCPGMKAGAGGKGTLYPLDHIRITRARNNNA